MAIIKPEVSENDFEEIVDKVVTRMIAKGGQVDPNTDGRDIANIVLAELGRRGYVVMKPKDGST